jgi:tRNA pseudouridine38-40 synthase
MVRIIVGTLIEVGRGRFAADTVPEALGSLDRDRAGPTAPASGLTLLRVDY